jgi:hypothetical protein
MLEALNATRNETSFFSSNPDYLIPFPCDRLLVDAWTLGELLCVHKGTRIVVVILDNCAHFSGIFLSIESHRYAIGMLNEADLIDDTIG